MPTEKHKAENLGHERKRKRAEEKVGKAGGKRPRRCDKENDPPIRRSTLADSLATIEKITTVQIPSSSSTVGKATTSLSSQNFSSVSSASILVDSIPRAIQSIHFLSPTNASIVPSQHKKLLIFPPKQAGKLFISEEKISHRF